MAGSPANTQSRNGPPRAKSYEDSSVRKYKGSINVAHNRILIDEPYLNNPIMVLLAEGMAERIQNQETDPTVERNLSIITLEKILN